MKYGLLRQLLGIRETKHIIDVQFNTLLAQQATNDSRCDQGMSAKIKEIILCRHLGNTKC
ncbi:Uncharacterised protein [Vibrio cholerae]|nr:Uncharacterised protein [Vibrio cholerae]CSB61561.1 Uncharacterised protein [Vibrio cholerae]CSC13298.1 Uncharacterised protein [Vibrio cholerae]CSI83437.1 Uncharacterised protein [Vibrio cholerae]